MKILVVDDEALLVKGIRFNLQNDGYEVITGSNGLEAVELVREGLPLFRRVDGKAGIRLASNDEFVAEELTELCGDE